jgi:hypothetical protein
MVLNYARFQTHVNRKPARVLGNFTANHSIQNTYHQRTACQKPAFPSFEWIPQLPEP